MEFTVVTDMKSEMINNAGIDDEQVEAGLHDAWTQSDQDRVQESFLPTRSRH